MALIRIEESSFLNFFFACFKDRPVRSGMVSSCDRKVAVGEETGCVERAVSVWADGAGDGTGEMDGAGVVCQRKKTDPITTAKSTPMINRERPEKWCIFRILLRSFFVGGGLSTVRSLSVSGIPFRADSSACIFWKRSAGRSCSPFSRTARCQNKR